MSSFHNAQPLGKEVRFLSEQVKKLETTGFLLGARERTCALYAFLRASPPEMAKHGKLKQPLAVFDPRFKYFQQTIQKASI